MTITQPTSAINPGSFKAQWSASDTFKFLSNGRTFPQPDHFKDDPFKFGYKQYVDQFVINKSSSVSIAYRSSINFNNNEIYHFWALNSGYLTGWIGSGQASTGQTLNSSKESGHPDNVTYVNNYDAILEFWTTSTTTLADQFTSAIHFRNVLDDADVDDWFETMPVKSGTTDSWSPVDENESCSSYSAIVTAKNINKIINQTNGSHTLLLWQRGTVPE